jgi:hypothetical protein
LTSRFSCVSKASEYVECISMNVSGNCTAWPRKLIYHGTSCANSGETGHFAVIRYTSSRSHDDTRSRRREKRVSRSTSLAVVRSATGYGVFWNAICQHSRNIYRITERRTLALYAPHRHGPSGVVRCFIKVDDNLNTLACEMPKGDLRLRGMP